MFGEIVEPCTRALIDEDEFDEFTEHAVGVPDWEGNAEPPDDIDYLIFIETERVKAFVQNCVLKEPAPVSKINNAGIEICIVDENKYFVIFSGKKNFTCNEITQLLEKWIKTAKYVCAITSESIYNYQNDNLQEKPTSLVKMLTSNNKNKALDYGILECPNLVTGLGASILTYCLLAGVKCNLYVIYVDTAPLDSLNMKSLLMLFSDLGISLKNTNISLTPASNLYM
ncbi:hypothetical protein NQ315_005393 [Exocentrus adspersus]|uniref:Proteasome assembly chaperone 1 n=1 Tax=Exocentrus adspersus TaxID=1586481 RepID=A0AAV8W233_9CUCU|nr:hypothetical protein NQ315_005393 [Exocentrus adspersus]